MSIPTNGRSSFPPDPSNLLAQQCMTFSAVMKALQGSLNTENVIPTADRVWSWVKSTLGEVTIGIPKEPTITSKITEPQQKRLYAISKKAKMTTEQLKAFLKENYGIESLKDIPWQQYNEICTAIEVGPPA